MSYLDKRRQRRQRISTIAGQKVGEELLEAQKGVLSGAEREASEKTFDQLEATALDDRADIPTRQAAVSRLVKTGQVQRFRNIMDRAVHLQNEVDDRDPLVEVFRTLKNNNELYEGFRDKAPDIAKSAFDEDSVTGKVTLKSVSVKDSTTGETTWKAETDFKFLTEDSVNGATKWDSSTWEKVINSSDREVRENILNNQGRRAS